MNSARIARPALANQPSPPSPLSLLITAAAVMGCGAMVLASPHMLTLVPLIGLGWLAFLTQPVAAQFAESIKTL